MKKPWKQYAVMLVRKYTNYLKPECSYSHILYETDTWAKSEEHAINNVMWRTGAKSSVLNEHWGEEDSQYDYFEAHTPEEAEADTRWRGFWTNGETRFNIQGEEYQRGEHQSSRNNLTTFEPTGETL